jgi:tetratricopeptide (TPR) repeat protein
MADRLSVMVSSTAKDLPEHRRQLIEACQRVGLFPLPMEHLPADPADAATVSVRMVDEADVYVGVFAYRYGYVPPGSDVSVTEMEYNRAVERGLPCLIFFMHEEHKVTPRDVETGPGAEKLARLKERIGKAHVAQSFKSPEDLRGHAIHSLEALQKQLREAKGGEPEPIRFHPVSVIPRPPEPYIAHAYALLQTGKLIGRQAELTALTDWVTGQGDLARVALLAVVAIGGMGKSALTWHWFQTVAEQEWPAARRGKLEGRLWWSFYESDAHFENFVLRALAYVLGRPEADVRKEVPSLHEQAEALLRELDRRPFLLVLDGLERILAAYAGANAAHLCDDERLDDETANRIGESYGLPAGAGQTVVGRHPQRRTADPRAGQFLRRLAGVRASRVLASSRLFPSDLQTNTGHAWPGSGAVFLTGLSEIDALDLWRAFGARGSREQLLPVLDTFGRHPLLIQVLAGVVAEFRDAPGDFDVWRQTNPDFRVFGLPLVQVRSHVLEHALRGLTEAQRNVLHTVAGFRMPVSIATLRALLVAAEQPSREPAESSAPKKGKRTKKPEGRKSLFRSFGELDAALTVLEDRGLLGWDRRANRYDLHPIVRGVVWEGLDEPTRRGVRQAQHSHFAAVPTPAWTRVESLDDLTPAVELFHALLDLGRYDDAFEVFRHRLEEATLWRLSAGRQSVAMLERLFPDGLDQPPRLDSARRRSNTLNALAQGYYFTGRPKAAAEFFAHAERIDRAEGDDRELAVGLANRSHAERCAGLLQNAEAAACEAVERSRLSKGRFDEGISLLSIGLVFAAHGAVSNAQTAYARAQRIFRREKEPQSEGLIHTCRAELVARTGDLDLAQRDVDRAERLAAVRRHAMDFIRVSRLQGTFAIRRGDLATADRRLSEALSHCRACDAKEEELATLIALAELRHRQGRTEEATELLDQFWEPAELGPYPLFHADALNLLARIERDAGHRDAADAATEAYRKAWCDGPPYAYYWGLRDARQLLAQLGAPEPDMPPFDPSRYPPIPHIKIDPPDEPAADGEGTEEAEP